MNWTTIDHTTQAAEIPGAGCFVMFFNHAVVFAPGVTIKRDTTKKKSNSFTLVASGVTQITFPDFPVTATSGTSTHVWFGDAGDKLDAKLAALEKKSKPAHKRPRIVNKKVGKRISSERVRD